MWPQAEGRLRGEVDEAEDEARGYHEGAQRVEISFCLLSSRWQAFIRRALPQGIAYDICSIREVLAASCDRFLDLGLQWSTLAVRATR